MKKIYLIIALILLCANSNAQTTIIAQNSSWKYIDNGSNQGTAWSDTSFSDTSWASGNAELGYGDGGEATVLSYGTSTTSRPITSYFRKTFSVANPSLYSNFTLSLLRDDGAVVYLNGVEVARSNMPTGTISYNTLASSEITGTNETAYTTYSINPSRFVVGNNVLAIELHQATTNNVDLSFNLKLTATTGTCGTPISLNATTIAATTATLNWSAVPNILSYSIQYRKTGTTTWTTVSASTNNKSITGLTHSSAYEFQVKANCLLGGTYSASSTFTTLTPTCDVPTNLAATNITAVTASLSWQAVTGASSYNIQYKKTGTTTWTTTTATTASKGLTGLAINTAYDFQVQAVCLITSAYSSVSNFTTLTASCGTPTNLVASSMTMSAASLSWTTISGATSYNIQYRKTGTTTWTTTTATTNNKSLSNLSSGTVYEFQVQAVCVITGAYSVPSTFNTLSLICGTPSALTSSAVLSTSATLSWTAVVGIANYNIQYRKSGTTAWTTTTSTTNSKSITGLLAATNYQFQVQAICVFSGSYSAIASFTTLPICGTPSNLITSAISTSSATLSWQAVTGATNYNIQYRPTGTIIWTTTTATTNNKSITGLNAATAYEFQVQTLCIENSAFSASSTFTTLTPCGIPSGLNADYITWQSAIFSWQTVSGATGYNIQYRPTGTAFWLTATLTNPSTAVSNLLAETSYEFQVQAICATPSDFSASAYFRTLPIPTCEIPTTLNATNITTTSALLSWQEVVGATGYNIQYRQTGATTWTDVVSTTANINLNNLLLAANYEFHIQAICIAISAYSEIANFSTLTPSCDVVTALVASNVSASTAVLSWQNLEGASGYNIQFRKVGSLIWSTTTATTNTKLLTGLSETSTYEFNIQGICTVPNNFSNTTTFTTLTSGTSYIFPANDGWKYLDNGVDQGTTWKELGFDDTTWTSANAKFGYGEGNEATIVNYGSDPLNKYVTTYFRKSFTVNNPEIYASLSFDVIRDDGVVVYLNGAEIYRNNMPSGTISYATLASAGANGTDESTWYSVALNASQFVSGNNVIAVEMHQQYYDSSDLSFNGRLSGTISSGCSTPELLTATVGSTSATIGWQASGGTSYNIQYRQIGTDLWTTLTSNTNNILLTGLQIATTYEYQIQSVCGYLSPFSVVTNFTTTLQACDTPIGLSTSSTSSSTVMLTWQAAEGASSYIAEYQLAGANAWISLTSDTNSKTITGLIASTGYEFRVKSVCSSSIGNYSNVLSYTTNPAGANTFIAASSTWKYLDNGINQETNWREVTFDDTTWKTGTAEFGYGDGDEATVVNYGPDASNKYVTTYFRKTFSIANPADYSALSLGIVRDDGVVVYLNGTEVYRDNMPTGTISYNSYAIESLGGSAETNWSTTAINPALLLAGTNVLAVEIHQQSVASSDLSFNGRLTAPSSSSTPVVIRGAYLQKLSPNSITIRWRTDIPSNTVVQYGTSVAYGNSAVDNTLVTEHIITVSGLTPNTKYFYTIGTTTETLQGDLKNNFITAPLVGTVMPVRIWGIGDFGNGTDHQLNVRNAYMNYTGTTPTNLWIWLGDDAYTKGEDTEFQSRVFAQYPDQFKNMPLFPTLGNHDYADVGYLSNAALGQNFPYFSIFSLPQNGESGGIPSNSPKYYSYDYANIHFISIDTYGCLTTAGSPLRTWLANDLAANTQRWTVVYLHHPPYTLGTHNSDTELELIDVRNNIVPLLESYKVDLVLAGHSHVNERSYMMKGHLGNSTTFSQSMKVSPQTNNFVKTEPYDGTVYAVCGTSGQDPEVVNQPGYPMAAMYFNNNTNNCSLVIDVNGDVLSCKYLASTGTVVDNFTITKMGTSARNSQQTSGDVTAKDALSVRMNQNTVNLDYTLSQDSEVTFELLNLMGESIITFKQIPTTQSAGDYNFEIPTRNNLAEGLYFIRMNINGKTIVKKVYMMH